MRRRISSWAPAGKGFPAAVARRSRETEEVLYPSDYQLDPRTDRGMEQQVGLPHDEPQRLLRWQVKQVLPFLLFDPQRPIESGSMMAELRRRVLGLS